MCVCVQTMTQDIVAVWQQVFGSSGDRVPTLLVGHSMGGALAVWAAATKQITGLEGVVVIDVVEGTALGRYARRWLLGMTVQAWSCVTPSTTVHMHTDTAVHGNAMCS